MRLFVCNLWLNSDMTESSDPNQVSRTAWDTNARVWDAHMGDEYSEIPPVLVARMRLL
jgi:hypothetical protein